jgi:hypothetical protein
MKTATEVPRAIKVNSYHYIAGDRIIETDCHDYAQYSTLPEVVTYQGRLFGKTGWSSDTGRACYKSAARIAMPH